MKTPKSLYSRLALATSVTLVVGYFMVYAVYENINSEEVASNATITSTLMGKIKNNLDTLNTQVTDLTATVVASSIWSKIGSDINYTAGKVQVGATTGNAELDIQSGIKPHWGIYHDSTTEELRFWNGDNRVVIGSTGNVGIGTVSPGYKLDISGDASLRSASTFRLFNANNSSQAAISNGGLGNSRLDFYTNATPAMSIDGGGNVGIGTTIPSAKLEVAGDIKVQGGITGTNFGQAFYSVMPNDMSFAAGGSALGSVSSAMPVGTYFYRIYGCSGQNNFTSGANGYFIFSSGGGSSITTEYFDNTNIGGGSCGVFRTGFIQITIPNSTVQFKIAGYSGGANTDLNPSANSISAYLNRVF